MRKRLGLSVRLLFSVSMLLFARGVTAQDIMMAVVDENYTPGSIAKIHLIVGNNTGEVYTVPASLPAYVKQQDPYDFLAVTLHHEGHEALVVEPGAFKRFVFRAQIPKEIQASFVQLGLDAGNVEPVYLHITQAETVQEEAVAATGVSPHPHPADIAEERAATLLDGVSTYKPIYFMFGGNPFDAKFQISLKYQLFNPQGTWAQEQNWLSGFHLGYTQVAFWDLSADSKPFEDTNFMPEVFYRIKNVNLGFDPNVSKLDLQMGLLHESNGRGEADSRSLNILYGRAMYERTLGDGWFFKLTGDVWKYVGDLKDNPDIAEFRGHSSLGLTLGAKEGIQFSSYRRGKLTNNKASYLFDVTVPIKHIGSAKNLNFTLHGQLFTGYGENLLTYDEKETRLRFGLGIHR